MNRTDLIKDIQLLQNDPSDANIDDIIEKYNIDRDNINSVDDIINILMQYTSHINQQPRTSQSKSFEPVRVQKPRRAYVELQPKFNAKKYQGLWYDVASIPQPFNMGTAWQTAQYTLLNSNVIEVVNTSYNEDDSIRGEIVGTAKILDPNKSSAIYVSFPTGQPPQDNPVANYLVHKTDYETYSVVGSYDKSNLYILTRSRPISRELYDNLLAYAQDLGYDVSLLKQDYGSVEGMTNNFTNAMADTMEDICIIL